MPIGSSRTRSPEKLEAVFWARVKKSKSCWTWTRGRDRKGYGVYSHQRQQIRASRMAWMLTNGPIPDGLQVLHRCDNPPCVRPDHLFLGTIMDNMHDKAQKGRTARGEKNGQAKLTPKQVRMIRKRIAAGETRTAIAADFHVTRTTIYFIATGKKWSHL